MKEPLRNRIIDTVANWLERDGLTKAVGVLLVVGLLVLAGYMAMNEYKYPPQRPYSTLDPKVVQLLERLAEMEEAYCREHAKHGIPIKEKFQKVCQ